ncbi:hypothetical protein N5P37_004335 [Trichoderma harzianum]|uniref:Cyclase n=1 Tax=Trichoderma harzianum CBS 226.95 TaxID=983964 RepID=A0A2T3ZRS4_TRIHA|nr:hypothetical protein M431DRAFT_526104 [Trichoderma harzianum CBS 226.95]KAK0763348.1 hypothetical protein N5P37_004335 [Trichoderma harzianum]PTB47491.1 hypothetical protein M431DRAFT_526104 [Trichoderma harzianum CBS 226.95]
MGSVADSPSHSNFDELPLHPSHPKASAWGLWGKDDELGTLNMLTTERVQEALREIMSGDRVPLNLAMNAFIQPMNPARKPCDHRIKVKGSANDNELHINTQGANTQGASHWVELRHYPYQRSLQYYNGIRQEDISGPSANHRIGIQNIAKNPITGRGVLLDWASWANSQGIQYASFSTYSIPLSQLVSVASCQGVSFHRGDILFLRTGWLADFRSLSKDEQADLPYRAVRSSICLEASEESIRWHWDNAFAAVASDTGAYEAWPSPQTWGVTMHEVFLSGWGLPIGESFDLEELERLCRNRGKWTFFVVSVPLNVPGGVASPSNAVAIL